MTHALSLTAGGIGLMSIYFIQDPSFLIVSMIGVGMAWASILAMPYAILAGSIPAHKMGVYMGIFNFFITFPQIVNGVIGGSGRQIFLRLASDLQLGHGRGLFIHRGVLRSVC